MEGSVLSDRFSSRSDVAREGRALVLSRNVRSRGMTRRESRQRNDMTYIGDIPFGPQADIFRVGGPDHSNRRQQSAYRVLLTADSLAPSAANSCCCRWPVPASPSFPGRSSLPGQCHCCRDRRIVAVRSYRREPPWARSDCGGRSIRRRTCHSSQPTKSSRPSTSSRSGAFSWLFSLSKQVRWAANQAGARGGSHKSTSPLMMCNRNVREFFGNRLF